VHGRMVRRASGVTQVTVVGDQTSDKALARWPPVFHAGTDAKRYSTSKEEMGTRRLIAVLSVVGMLVSAKADKRVAFVVGNGADKNVTRSPNPPIDAKSMARVLRNAGFDVVEGINLTRTDWATA
jgi:hypothetical protein